MAYGKILRKPLPTQVKIAIFEACLFVDVITIPVNGNRQRLGAVQYLKLFGLELVCPVQVGRVHHLFRTLFYKTREPDHILQTQFFCRFDVRAEHDLHGPAAVSKVDKDDLAVVPAGGDPAA